MRFVLALVLALASCAPMPVPADGSADAPAAYVPTCQVNADGAFVAVCPPSYRAACVSQESRWWVRPPPVGGCSITYSTEPYCREMRPECGSGIAPVCFPPDPLLPCP